MKKYAVMGTQDGQVFMYDTNCSKCNGTGRKGRIATCLKDVGSQGKYVPCRCVIAKPIPKESIEKKAQGEVRND